MNLLEFRLYFRRHSGRFDLVSDAGADLGIGDFLAPASKFLERLADIKDLQGTLYLDLGIGMSSIVVPNAKVIATVGIIKEDGSTHPLVYYDPADIGLIQRLNLQTLINAQYMSATPKGMPKAYSLRSPRLLADDTNTDGAKRGYDATSPGARKLYFLPTADQTYSLEIKGQFYTGTLTNDTDTSYWTAQQPNLLYMAVMRQLEIIHRNSAGVADWESAIKGEIISIDMDGVAQGLVGDSEMELL